MKKIPISLLIILGVGLILYAHSMLAQAKITSLVSNIKVKASPASIATATKPKTVSNLITPKATAKPIAKPVLKPKALAVKTSSKYKITMTWDASGLKYLSNSAAFDYNTTIRNAVIKKIENYARRNNIKVITRAVVDEMRE